MVSDPARLVGYLPSSVRPTVRTPRFFTIANSTLRRLPTGGKFFGHLGDLGDTVLLLGQFGMDSKFWEITGMHRARPAGDYSLLFFVFVLSFFSFLFYGDV